MFHGYLPAHVAARGPPDQIDALRQTARNTGRYATRVRRENEVTVNVSSG